MVLDKYVALIVMTSSSLTLIEVLVQSWPGEVCLFTFLQCNSTQIIDWDSVVEYVCNPGAGFVCNPREGFVGGQCETNELFLHSAHSPSSFPFITYSSSLALHRSHLAVARQDLSVERGGKVFLLSAHFLRFAVSVFVVILVDFDKYFG